jgi:hypothetical protein
MNNTSNPKYPLYIVSKNRAESRLTVKSLELMNVPYTVVIEESNFDEYARVIDPKNLLILDPQYLKDYDTFDDLGDTKSKGPGAARNFAWEHSMSLGFDRHWVMDDNIRYFYRLNNNKFRRAATGAVFRAMEDFSDRYTNVAISGPQYFMFIPRKSKLPPFVTNTRIYSCNLILNKIPYRWRGRYNEDTDLSLRALKDGWCTIQFNAFVQDKTTTQVIGGGNTEEFYSKEGTTPKSEMLKRMHPDVTKLVYRYGRAHHHVNYLPFKKNKLRKIKNLEIDETPNEYGMQIQKLK